MKAWRVLGTSLEMEAVRWPASCEAMHWGNLGVEILKCILQGLKWLTQAGACCLQSLKARSSVKWLQFLCKRWYRLPLYSLPICCTKLCIWSLLMSVSPTMILSRYNTANSPRFQSYPSCCFYLYYGAWKASPCALNDIDLVKTLSVQFFIRPSKAWNQSSDPTFCQVLGERNSIGQRHDFV